MDKRAVLIAVLLLASPALAQNAYHFPQFADGGGYTTRFLIQNTSTDTVNATLKFYDDNGNPAKVAIDSTNDSSFSFQLPKNGTKILSTSGSGSSTVVGWAVLRVDTLTDLLTTATFRYAPGGTLSTEVGVPASPLSDSFTAPALNDTTTQLGFAFANPNSTAVNVSMNLLADDGTNTGKTTQISLPKFGHTAFYLWQKFTGIDNFRGSCQIKSIPPDDATPAFPIAVLALTQSGVIYSSTPVTPKIAGINMGTGSYAISPLIRGINYYVSSPNAVIDSIAVIPRILSVGMQVARYGGGSADSSNQIYIPDEGRIDRFVTYCRQIKVEPWIQVPLYYSLYRAGTIGPDVLAASFVKYCNIDHTYNVKLWSIGNEPDIYRNLTPEYTADAYSKDFRKIAAAMKAVDPYIKIIGPEFSGHYDVDGAAANNWFTPFLTNCGDIVDIIGLHRYPFNGMQTISVSMTDSPTVAPQIDRLREEIKNVTGRDIPLIFSENNLTWQYDATQMIPEGMGSSLAAGLWWADVLGRFVNKNLYMAYLWDLVYDDGLSMFEALTQVPRPTFYTFSLYSHFHNWRLPADTNASNLSVVASRNDGNEDVSLVIVNRSSSDLSAAVRISGSSTFDPGTNYIRVQNSWDPLSDRTIVFPQYSMTCLQISRDGQTRRRWSYSNDEFTHGAAPTASDW